LENPTYTTLTRQSGLWSEMRAVANNIANSSTTGFRSEGVIFSEYVRRTGTGFDSLSMATARVRETSFAQGALSQTGGPFDLAIEGDGFFLVQTPQGDRLTRAGHFLPNANGDLVTPEGYPVLDAGGSPVFVPQGTGPVGIAADGTISADGQPVGQIGIVRPLNPDDLIREDGVRFSTTSGYEPLPEGRMLQGWLEESNVDPVLQVARMIEVGRAYELGQSFLDRENDRILTAIRSLSK
jgi:flagellar basal-body rod protein FlgF